MALIFLGLLIVLTFQVLNFMKSNCRDFIANDEWYPIHRTSIRFEENAGVLSQAVTETKTVSKFTEAL